MQSFDVQLKSVAIDEIRPTQMTAGYREVATKRRELAALKRARREQEMAETILPAVVGPGQTYYIIDHHHDALARLQEGAEDVSVAVIKDLSTASDEMFWTFLDHHNWVHCYDEHGERQPWRQMPRRLDAMRDDPYRSLAASVRDAGGFAKSDEPFLEFLWANFFREKIGAQEVSRHFARAKAAALKLARSEAACFLPGWSGKAS